MNFPENCSSIFKVLVLFSSFFRIFILYINTGSPNVIDALGQGISRGVYNDVVFANFKAHKFSYLNVTSLRTEYVVNSNECWFACVKTPSCFSLNLAAFLDITGKELCELLPSDKYKNSDKFVGSKFFHHFSIWVRLDTFKMMLVRDFQK